jgi:putative SOS response-associated peptidase YedK
MPALLSPDRWAAWLGESSTAESELKAMLKPYPGAATTYCLSTGGWATSATTTRIYSPH